MPYMQKPVGSFRLLIRITQLSITIFERLVVGFGNFGFILSSVSVIIKPTTRFLSHFLFAGMMYQGAHNVLDLLMMS